MNKLDWLRLGLLAVAIWILYDRNKGMSSSEPIDWPDIIAVNLIADYVIAVLWGVL